MPEPSSAAPTTPTPLRAQLTQASAEARAGLAEFGFAPESYENLTRRALDVAGALRGRGAPAAADRIEALTRVLGESLEAAPSDLSARGRAYLALLESVMIQSIAHEARGAAWLAALDAQCGDDARGGGVTLGGLSLLTVAQMCVGMGARVTAPRGGLSRVEWQGWRIGLVGAGVSSGSEIAGVVAGATGALKDARMAGLVVVDLADLVCPERRPLRATHPDAGGQELRARLDRVLQESRRGILEAADHDHALGVIGAAFLSIHLVPVNQVAFITAYRFMSLLDQDDPRERKLAGFRRRFGDL